MTLASIEYLGDLEPKVESYIINHNLHECKASKNSNSSFLEVLIRDQTENHQPTKKVFFGKLDQK